MYYCVVKYIELAPICKNWLDFILKTKVNVFIFRHYVLLLQKITDK